MQDFRHHLQCDVEGDLTSPVVWPISPHRTPVLRTISMAGHHVERGIDCARLNSPSETGQAWLKKITRWIIIKKKLNDDKKWNTANQSNHRDEKTNKDCRRVKPRIYISNRVGCCRSWAIRLKAAEVRTVFCDMKVFYGNDHVFSKASTSPSAV